ETVAEPRAAAARPGAGTAPDTRTAPDARTAPRTGPDARTPDARALATTAAAAGLGAPDPRLRRTSLGSVEDALRPPLRPGLAVRRREVRTLRRRREGER